VKIAGVRSLGFEIGDGQFAATLAGAAAFDGVGRQESEVRAQGRFLDGGSLCGLRRLGRGCMGRVGQRQAACEGGEDNGGDDLVHGFLLLG
jgi:hypothetical protein